ncbi:MAG: hypothetical protein ACFFAS_12505 [Promethearchaeota archaeon]
MILFTSDPALIFTQGAMTWIFTALSFLLGILMFQKYYQYKDKQLLLVGVTWIFLTTPWWGDAITFVYYIATSEVLPDPIYFFLANAFIAPIFYTWPKTIGELVIEDKPRLKKAIRSILMLWAIIFEIAFVSIFFIDPNLIGLRKDYYIADWAWFVSTFILSGSLLLTITGMVFSYKAITSEKPTIQLKGIFLMDAFLVFSVATFLEVLLDVMPIVIIARILGISAALCFYIGFVLPKFIRKRFGL